MKRALLLCFFAATMALGSPAFAQSTGRERIVSGEVAAKDLELRGLTVGGDGSVTGAIGNRSGVVVKDVDLLVSHTWHWNDERHPGEDNPGRATPIRVKGEIPPKGSLPFSYTPDPPLLKRRDGSFETTVAVQSFTEIGD